MPAHPTSNLTSINLTTTPTTPSILTQLTHSLNHGTTKHRRRRPNHQRHMLRIIHNARRSRSSRVSTTHLLSIPSTHQLTGLSLHRSTNAGSSAFFLWPLFGPLLFENESSDARDHCANERSMFQNSPLLLTHTYTHSLSPFFSLFFIYMYISFFFYPYMH